MLRKGWMVARSPRACVRARGGLPRWRVLLQ